MNKKAKSWIFTILLMGFILIVSNNCKKDIGVPLLITSEIDSITQTSAICGGKITSDGGAPVTVRGVCWSTNQPPSITDSKTTDGKGIGSFKSIITGLIADTTYFVRAYAINSEGTGYGKSIMLTTLEKIVFNPHITYGSIVDIDGNKYRTVTIGTQTWMAENLRTIKYRNGVTIPEVTNNSSWCSLKFGAYCNYNNTKNIDTIETYGRLYNWYAIDNSQNIAPFGWHVATVDDWCILINYLKLEYNTYLMYLAATSGWDNNKEAIGGYPPENLSGFTALPGGSQHLEGFSGLGKYAVWWTPTRSGSWAISFSLNNFGGGNFNGEADIINGCSIRCVKD